MQLAIASIKNFLTTCKYISLSADESDTFSGSAPMAASLQAVNSSFEFMNVFAGQVDVAADKTGRGLHEKLKGLIDAIDKTIWPKIFQTCFDGASNMRSSPFYMGLDANPSGTSLHAFMKKSIGPNLANIHCLPHQFNLGYKNAYESCPWAVRWLQHIKVLYTWFSKSPGRKNALTRLHKTMQTLQQACTWRLVYPKYYCPTRWLGLYKAVVSILKCWDLLVVYANDLIEQGYLPDRTTLVNEPTQEELQGAELADARVEEDDDDEAEGFFHEAAFHDFKNKSWDLEVGTIDGDDDLLPTLTVIALDHGNFVKFKDLDDGGIRKRSKLLNEVKGLTNFNQGLNCMMADIMLPYTLLVTKLQKTCVPIAHRVCSWVHTFFNSMNRFLGPRPTWGRR